MSSEHPDSQAPFSRGDPDVSAVLLEALDKVAAPGARDKVLSNALDLAGVDALPDEIPSLLSFVVGPLQTAADRMLGTDVAHALVSDVRPLLEMAFRMRTSAPPPASTAPPVSTLPPDGLYRAPRRQTLPYFDSADTRGFVLIVDDDIAFLRGFSRLLRIAGYDAVTAPDGHAALRLCHRLAPALVISDLEMPPPNGLALAELIAESMGEAAPPVLLLTGTSNAPRHARGVSGVLSKTIRPSELLAEIEPYLAPR
jgi:CheY-like chemotaxis protein